MEDIGTPQECQMHCNQVQDCKGFAHLFSNQTCWLKQDILQTVYLSSSPYIGPKQCLDENSTALAEGIKYQIISFFLNINILFKNYKINLYFLSHIMLKQASMRNNSEVKENAGMLASILSTIQLINRIMTDFCTKVLSMCEENICLAVNEIQLQCKVLILILGQFIRQ